MLKTVADVIVNSAKQVEENYAPGLVVLHGFPRSLQLDNYSCGAQCAFAILKYYGKARSIINVKREAGTNSEGTDEYRLRSLFKKRGLRPTRINKPTIAKIKREINSGFPILVGMGKYADGVGGHYAVVYGYGTRCVFVADPAVWGSLFCRHSTDRFLQRWDKTAMTIRTIKKVFPKHGWRRVF